MQELLGDAPDLCRHGGGEKQRLARERNELADTLDVGNEAHVEHAVGFVDHQQLDAREQKPASLEVIKQAARCSDQHIDAAGEFGILIVKRNAADDQGDVELVIFSVLLEAVLDLCGEFARRFEDQRARHPRSRPALLEHGEHRQGEGRGLAGAGLGYAQDIAVRQHVGNGLVLDRGWGGVTGRLNGGENLVGQTEM